ncbi:MAG: GntR family transcriptional regulator, partial [Pseudomonadota bacterium]|nr:GntR family transcriptional regulator [Pseudomonadota bacterium]
MPQSDNGSREATAALQREEADAENFGLVPAKSANAITARLRHAIETGVFGDGDQLPPERQLAVALGTARSTIRKALDQLEQKNLVMRRVGSGTFVNYAGPLQSTAGDVADLISPLQLIETRMAVEPYMTKLAAIHATEKDLDSIEVCLEQLDGAATDQDRFTHWDAEF